MTTEAQSTARERIIRHPEQMAEWFAAYGVQLQTIGEDGDWLALGHIEPRRMIAAMRKAARDELRLDDDEVFGSRQRGEPPLTRYAEHRRAYFTEPDAGDYGWHAHWGPDAETHEASVDVTLWRA